MNSDAAGIYDEDGILFGGEIDSIEMPKAEDISSSPYIVRYQDFGLVDTIIPTKTYSDSMKNEELVKVGERINYKITYGNDDTIESCQIVIKDELDKGLTVVQNSISHGGIWRPHPTGKTGGTITWTLDDVRAATNNGYVTFSAVVNQKATGKMKVENSANLYYTFKSNEEREYTVGPLVNPLRKDDQPGVKGYEVTVRKDSDPAPGSLVETGQKITYFLEVKNTGAAIAPYTVVRDYIPEGTTYVDGSASIKDRVKGTYVSDHAYVEWVVKDLEPNEAIILAFSVNVDENPPEHILNVAHYDSPDDNPGNPGEVPEEPGNPTNEIEHTTDPEDPIPAILLGVKDADPAPGTEVASSETITYKITIKNNGGETARNVYVKDLIPAKTTFQSVPTDNGGKYQKGGNYVSWLIPEMEAGKSVTVSFVVTVNEPTDGGVIINQAAYEMDWKLNLDGTPQEKEGEEPSNTTNIVEHPTPVEKPSLEAVKSSDPVSGTQVKSGNTITYAIKVKNSGRQTAKNVYVKDSIPAKTSFKSVPSDNQGKYQKAGNYVSWLIPEIGAGKEVTVSFVVIVNGPNDGSEIVNQAAYDKDWEMNEDGNPIEGVEPSNPTNTIKHPTPVEKPNLAAEKSSDPVSGTKVKSGSTIVYTIKVTNTSDTDAEAVYVRDYIPEYMSYVGVANNGSYNSEKNYVSWNIGMIKAGQSASVSFTARVLSSAVNKEVVNYALYEDNWNLANVEDPINQTNKVVHPVTTSGGGGGGNTPTNPTSPAKPTDPINPTEPTNPTDPSINPPIVPPGHSVVPVDPRTYVEYDENGTPLGTWRLNDNNIWVLDSEIPLAALAKTGDSRTMEGILLSMACISLCGVAVFTRARKKRDDE